MELWCCCYAETVVVVAEHCFGFQQQRLELEEDWGSVVVAIAVAAVDFLVAFVVVSVVVVAAVVVGVVVVAAVVVLDVLLPLVAEEASKGLKIHYSGKEIVVVAAVVVVVDDLKINKIVKKVKNFFI